VLLDEFAAPEEKDSEVARWYIKESYFEW
jgi:hypothetical protein